MGEIGCLLPKVMFAKRERARERERKRDRDRERAEVAQQHPTSWQQQLLLLFASFSSFLDLHRSPLFPFLFIWVDPGYSIN
jgi:hypothetical protein